MLFLLEISSLKQIEKNISKVDGFIMGYESFTSFSAYKFSFDEIEEATKLSKNIYVNLNEMLHNSKQDEFKKVIFKLASLCVHFIVQDFGAALLIKDIIELNKVIFNPVTLITNEMDAQEYNKLGFEGIICSSEITCQDLRTISLANNNIGCVGFGYHPMYQSYRHIIDLYTKTLGIKNKNRDALFLKEWTRDKKYHVLDTSAGSVIFRPYVLSLFKEFNLLTNVKIFILNTIFLSDEQINYVCDLINDFKSNIIDANTINQKLEEKFDIEDGFIYEDSIYNPEEF
ncbi:MAG: U32 family peptidase [Bacilli bacterium]